MAHSYCCFPTFNIVTALSQCHSKALRGPASTVTWGPSITSAPKAEVGSPKCWRLGFGKGLLPGLRSSVSVNLVYGTNWTILYSECQIEQELSSCWDEWPFGHNRHGPKSRGLLCNLPWGRAGAGSPSNTMWPGRGLALYQVASWSIQPLIGHNRHGPKIGGYAPFFWGGGLVPM